MKIQFWFSLYTNYVYLFHLKMNDGWKSAFSLCNAKRICMLVVVSAQKDLTFSL